MKTTDSVVPLSVDDMEEANEQSTIKDSRHGGFEAFLNVGVTAVETAARMKAQYNQVATFDTDDPGMTVDETTKMVLLGECEDANVGYPQFISNSIFISDVMDLERERSRGYGTPTFDLTPLSVMNSNNMLSEVEDTYGNGNAVSNVSSIDSSSTPMVNAKILYKSGEESMLDCDQLSSDHNSNGSVGTSRRVSPLVNSKSNVSDLFDGGCKGTVDSSVAYDTSKVITVMLESNSSGSSCTSVSTQHHDQDSSLLDSCLGDHKSPNKRRKFVLFEQTVVNADDGELVSATGKQSASSESNAQLGGAVTSGMGHSLIASSGLLADESQQASGYNVMSDVIDDEVDFNSLLVTRTPMKFSTGRSVSKSSSLRLSHPVRRPSKQESKKIRRKENRNRTFKKSITRVGNNYEVIDQLFHGDLPLDLDECFSCENGIDADKNQLFQGFQSMVDEYFPQQRELCSDIDVGTQLIYAHEDEVAEQDLSVFTANVKELLMHGRSIWLVLDTGANQHVIKDLALIDNKQPTFHKVTGVSGDVSALQCSGEVTLHLEDRLGNNQSLPLSKVYGLSKCPFNLVSVSKLLDNKCCLHLDGFTDDYYLRLPHSKLQIPIIRKNGLLMIKSSSNESNVSLGGDISLKISLNGLITESPDSFVEPSLSFSEQDHGMTAPLIKWHLRMACKPVSVLKRIHNHSMKLLKLNKDFSDQMKNSGSRKRTHGGGRKVSSTTVTTDEVSGEKMSDDNDAAAVVDAAAVDVAVVNAADVAAAITASDKCLNGSGGVDASVVTSNAHSSSCNVCFNCGSANVDSCDEFGDRTVGKNEPMIHGFYIPKDDKSLKTPKCDVCYQAKMRRKAQKHASPFPDSILIQGRTFSCDLKSVPTKSFFGHNYVLCFVEHVKDGAPGISFHYYMKHKSETTAKLQLFLNDCKKLGIKVARIQSDRGSEFFEQEGVGAHFDERALHSFRALCSRNNIIHTVTPVDDKEKYAERWIKENFKLVDTTMWNARLGAQFWTYALNYVSHQRNRTPAEVNGVWYKAPHHYFTGEVPRWDKYRVFGCDAFSMIPHNKYAKYPGMPTATRAIFVGFDADGGALLFDLNKRRHFHSSNVYFNESFANRHNALHYYDQRRDLLDKDSRQPLQLNDFDAPQASEVRSLYSPPEALRSVQTSVVPPVQVSQRNGLNDDGQSTNASIGGDGRSDSQSSGSSNRASPGNVTRHLFSDNLDSEQAIVDHETGNSSIRPLRLVKVGRKEKWTTDHHNFLQQAELSDYTAIMLQPCPKKGNTPSSKRYRASMSGSTLRQIKELGSTQQDIVWNFAHGYITFPGHESSRSGHIFTASLGSVNNHVFNVDIRGFDVNDKKKHAASTCTRSSAFNSVLSSIDEEATSMELLELVTDRLAMIKLGDKYANIMSLSAAVNPKRPSLDEFVIGI